MASKGRRKHRLVVEVTFDHPVPIKTAKDSVKGVLQVGSEWTNVNPYATGRELYLEKFVVKAFSRVVQAMYGKKFFPTSRRRNPAVARW